VPNHKALDKGGLCDVPDLGALGKGGTLPSARSGHSAKFLP